MSVNEDARILYLSKRKRMTCAREGCEEEAKWPERVEWTGVANNKLQYFCGDTCKVIEIYLVGLEAYKKYGSYEDMMSAKLMDADLARIEGLVRFVNIKV